MINIIISLLVGIGIFLLSQFVLGWHWIIGIILGQIAAIAVFFLLAKVMMKKITAIIELANEELTKGQFDRAISVLESGFKYQYRHPFIASQLNSQIGVIHYYKKDFKKAEEYLKKGIASHYIGQCMLGILYMKKKDEENMNKAFKAATRASGKESIVWSLYAYCLSSLGKKNEAIEVLSKGQKRLPGDENIKANLTALQNNQKMKMRAYKEMWSIFMLEKTIVRQQPPRFVRGGGGGVRRIYKR
jgi:tetratricopeptide (TPR) repeat protein